MAVLLTPFFLQFEDENGVPVRNGRVWTYAAGTTTPKATYTDFTEQFQLPNPVPLDAAGRATIWINGFYKFVLEDANGVVIRTTDNVSSFIAGATEGEPPFYQQLSGDGTQTVFTLLEDLGTDSGALFVFVNNGTDAGYEIQYPTSYEINGTELTFNTAPSAGVNNIYVFAPVRLLTAAAASASEAASSANAAALSAIDADDAKVAAEAAQLAAESAQTGAETAEGNAEAAQQAAEDARDLSQEWASKTDGIVDATDYSAKAWAIGGTGTETNNAKYYAEQALINSGFVWRGVWVAGTYTVNEAVEHNGSSWIALATTSEEPSLMADDWDLLALKGADGEGLTDGDKGGVTVTGNGSVWTINNGAVSAAGTSYDNTSSGLTATNVQEAVDEITGGLGSASAADLIDDDTFATATPDNVPSAESVKAYVDANSPKVAIITEEYAANASCPAMSAADLFPINTIREDPESIIDNLTSNRITFAEPGRYKIQVSFVRNPTTNTTVNYRTYFVNDTLGEVVDSTVSSNNSSGGSSSFSGVTSASIVFLDVMDASHEFEVWIESTNAWTSSNLSAVNRESRPEIYTLVSIEKVR